MRGEAKSVHSGGSTHSGYSRNSQGRLSTNGQPKIQSLRGLIPASRDSSVGHISLTFVNQVTIPKRPYCSCRFTKIFLSITAVSAVIGGIAGVIVSEVKPDDFLAWTGLKYSWKNDLAAAAVGFGVSAASVLLGRAFWWCCCNKPRLYSDRTEPLLSMNQGLGMVRAASGLSLPDMGTQRPVLSKQSSFLSVARSTQPSRRTASVNHPSIQEFCI